MPLAKPVRAPRAIDYIPLVLEPDAANDNVGIAVLVDISESDALAVRTVDDLLGPLAALLLPPQVYLIASVMPEIGLVPGNNVQVSITVQITKLYVMRGMIGDLVRFPGPAGRVALRSGIFIPKQASHHNVKVAVAVHVAEFSVDGFVSAFGDQTFRPVRVRIPHKWASTTAYDDIGEAVAVNVSQDFRPGVLRTVTIHDDVI